MWDVCHDKKVRVMARKLHVTHVRTYVLACDNSFSRRSRKLKVCLKLGAVWSA